MSEVFADTFTAGSDTDLDVWPNTSPNNDWEVHRGSAGDNYVNAANDRVQTPNTTGDAIHRLTSNATVIDEGKISTTAILGNTSAERYSVLCCRCDTGGTDHYLVEHVDSGSTLRIYRYTGSYSLLVSASRTISEPCAGSLEVTGTGAQVDLEAIWDSTAAVTFGDTAGARITSGPFGIGLIGSSGTANVGYIDDISVDDLVASVIYERTLSSSINISDPQTRLLDAQRALVSSINVQDIIAQEALLTRIVTSNIDVSDSITRVIASIVSRTLSSSVSINDSINTILHLTRGLTDSVAITDSIIRTLELNNLLERILSSNININDSIATQKWMERQLLDNLDISDSIARTITGAATIISRILSDSVTVEDAITSTKDFTRQLASSITLIDTLASSKELCRLLQDNIDVVDSLTKETILLLERTLSNTITITDVISRDITLSVTGIIIAKLAIEPIEVGVVNEIGRPYANSLVYSEQIDNAIWDKGSLLTVTPNDINDPNGDLTADKIEVTTGGAARLLQGGVIAVDTEYLFDIHLKQGNKLNDIILIRNLTTARNLIYSNFSWTLEEFGVIQGDEAANGVVYKETLSDGWFRLGISVTSGITLGDNLAVYFSFTSIHVLGEYVYGWGAQLIPDIDKLPYYKVEDTTVPNILHTGGAIIPGLEKLDIGVGLERYTT